MLKLLENESWKRSELIYIMCSFFSPLACGSLVIYGDPLLVFAG